MLEPQTGKGEARKIKLDGSGFYSNPVWSRDSKTIVYRDNSQTLYALDVTSGKSTKIVEPKYGRPRSLSVSSWSPDSKWLAYTNDTPAQIARVYVYSVEAGKSFPITDGLSEAVEPAFDASGKYLYFLGSNDTGMSKHGFSQSSADSRSPRWSLHLAVLAKDEPSPFLRESDEEKGPEAKKAPEPRIAGRDADDDEPEKDEPKAKGKRKGEKDKPFKIDLEGIDQRILAFPLPSGSYGGLQAGSEGQVFYVARQEGEPRGGRGAGPRGGALHRYDMERKRDTVVQPSVTAYELTPDGRKMLYSTGGDNWFVGSTSGGGSGGATPSPTASGGGRGRRPGAAPSSGDGGDDKLNLEAIEVRVEPRAEWKQIFDEAWRINRDYFYDPNMHGADWPAIKKKYEVFLPHVTHGGDLYRVIGWMLSRTGRRPQPVLSRRARSTTARRSPAGCSGPTTKQRTAATASRRSTAA